MRRSGKSRRRRAWAAGSDASSASRATTTATDVPRCALLGADVRGRRAGAGERGRRRPLIHGGGAGPAHLRPRSPALRALSDGGHAAVGGDPADLRRPACECGEARAVVRAGRGPPSDPEGRATGGRARRPARRPPALAAALEPICALCAHTGAARRVAGTADRDVRQPRRRSGSHSRANAPEGGGAKRRDGALHSPAATSGTSRLSSSPSRSSITSPVWSEPDMFDRRRRSLRGGPPSDD